MTSPRSKATLAATFGAALLAFGSAAVSDGPPAKDTRVTSPREVASDSATTAPSQASPAPSGTASTSAPAPVPAAPAPTPAPELREAIDEAADGTALALLASVAVKGRSARTGYDRDLFGQAWADTDRNGCDTRNDILGRDLTGITYEPGTRNCKVLAGTLAEPYTGRAVAFRSEDAAAVQIDHVVALSDAWQKGAAQWPAAKRLAFANDPLNLLAVDGQANGSKSDGDAATWLPPNKAYRCPMVARQVAVKAKYGLWMTVAEHRASARVLAGCPAHAAPTGSAPTSVPGARSEPAAPVRPVRPGAPAPGPGASGELEPDHGTCKAAKALGAGPYHEGQDPEYAWYRDNDGDGTVCE